MPQDAGNCRAAAGRGRFGAVGAAGSTFASGGHDVVRHLLADDAGVATALAVRSTRAAEPAAATSEIGLVPVIDRDAT